MKATRFSEPPCRAAEICVYARVLALKPLAHRRAAHLAAVPGLFFVGGPRRADIRPVDDRGAATRWA